jgi:dTDP-4-amino-4,6-dideoxygalactose transaminase
VEEAGYKFNMPDVLAALGCAQLAKSDRFREQRKTIAASYNQAFAAVDEVELPPPQAPNTADAWHLYILRLRPDRLAISRNAFIEELKRAGIGTSVHFIPLHLHPFYRRTYGYAPGNFPNAEDSYSRCISLPIFPGMTGQEIERVIAAVKQVAQTNRRTFLQAAS